MTATHATREKPKTKKRNYKTTVKRPMTDQDKVWWDKICRYIEGHVLGYDENQHLQKQSVLRIKGLQTGKPFANSHTKDNGFYPFEVIYGAVIIAQPKLIEAIQYRNLNFDSEDSKLAYFLAIARNQLNDVYTRWQENKRADEIYGKIDYSDDHVSAEYIPQESEQRNKDSEELW